MLAFLSLLRTKSSWGCGSAMSTLCMGSQHFGTSPFGSGMLLQMDGTLIWDTAIERRAGSPAIVEELALGELRGNLGDAEGRLRNSIRAERLARSTPRPKGGLPSPLRPSRRWDAQGDAPLLAVRLELRHSWRINLAAPVHLDGADRERHGRNSGASHWRQDEPS